MKLKSLLLSSLLLLSAGTAWADVEINETNFPDENFRNWLSSQTYGSDGKLTDEEIAGVTSINVSGTYFSPGTISSLKGIDFFTALEDLRCSDNQLNSLNVSGCTALRELNCSSNQLTSLNVSGCTALTNLYCNNNLLTSLIVNGCVALTNLQCTNNLLTSLDVTNNTKLTDLYCSTNQLASLDVTKNIVLEHLYCSENKLTSLDVSKNTVLTQILCQVNKLTSLDVSQNPKLKHLHCYMNKLTSLDFSNNPALHDLEFYFNSIFGKNMDAIISSLPIDVEKVTMQVFYDNVNGDKYEGEVLVDKNIMTTAQVAAAKAKGWTPRYFDGTEWKEYPGVDPATAIAGVETDEASDSAPWFTLGGAQLDNAPTAPGIYIHGGKKVVVK